MLYFRALRFPFERCEILSRFDELPISNISLNGGASNLNGLKGNYMRNKFLKCLKISRKLLSL